MKRWNSYIEIVKFPFIMLFIATFIMGVCGIILNPNNITVFTIENDIVILFAELFKYFGGFVVSNFSLLILIKILSKNFEGSVPVFIGVVAYILFNVTTMFLTSLDMPATAYTSVLGLSINITNYSIVGAGIKFPIETGIIAALIVAGLTRKIYIKSRSRSPYGFLSFVDRNTAALISTLFYTLLSAVAISYIWPYFIDMLYSVFGFIANDITNPMNLFVYGIFDRGLSILNMPALIRGPFWFGEMGGSWINSVGTNYLGDVAVWTAQSANGLIDTGAGRLITPYFILNIFAVPAVIIGVLKSITDKFAQRRYIIFGVIAIVASVVSGILLPFEFYLLMVAPMLFGFHILATGILFAVMQALQVFIGYSYSGSTSIATPASIVDLIQFARNPATESDMQLFIIVGILTFIAYLLMTVFYLKKGAMDFMNTGKGEATIEGIIFTLGGIDNIKSTGSTTTKLLVQVEDSEKMDFNRIQKYGAYKIVESRAGYIISIGMNAYMIHTRIKQIKKRNELQNTQQQ